MMDLPKDIDLDRLPGPARGVSPAFYIHDEVVWSPDRRHFALAYTIFERTMANAIGCVLWAKGDQQSSTILQNPSKVYAICWRSPWCRWLDDDVFVFKATRYNGQKIFLPLVAIHVTDGYQVLAGTNSYKIWFDEAPRIAERWEPFDETKLVDAIEQTGRE